MKKIVLFIISILMLAATIYFNFFFNNHEDKKSITVEEEICKIDCKIGDKIVLNDGSSWHILNINNGKITLFSDANVDLEGNYLPLKTLTQTNTGMPIAFDKPNQRTTENNPYCIFQDLGCSSYEKNGVDVFEDSNIKKVVDSNFLPKITETLKTDEVIIRLMKAEEFNYFKDLEIVNNTRYDWLYYSGYWLMTPYNSHSLFVHREKEDNLTLISAYIPYGYGIRPVIEVDYDVVL